MEYLPLIERCLPAITAVATMAMAVATVVLVRATHRIAKVSERTLKAGTTPQVVAYLERHFHDHIVPDVTIVLENTGQGTAQNVKYKVNFEDEGGKKIAKKYFIANKTDLKIDFMPQGTKREMTLGSTVDLYDKSTGSANSANIAPFNVTVQYENLEGKQYRGRVFTLDIDDFEGTGGVETTSLVDLERSLRSLPKIERHIERHIERLAKNP